MLPVKVNSEDDQYKDVYQMKESPTLDADILKDYTIFSEKNMDKNQYSENKDRYTPIHKY